MVRRAGQILDRVVGVTEKQRSTELHWSGTFDSVGARLLREMPHASGCRTPLPYTTVRMLRTCSPSFGMNWGYLAQRVGSQAKPRVWLSIPASSTAKGRYVKSLKAPFLGARTGT
jgi:hypothetical protein